MCQLLGLNCAAPTDCTFSLKGFCRRGGATDKHSHGFGLCVYEGRGVRTFHDTLPACQSPIAELVQKYPIRTYNCLAHIRYATQGQVSLENVHPFTRVWKGVTLTFCHNGDCPKFIINNNNNNNPSHNQQAAPSTTTTTTTPLLGNTRPCDRIYHPVGDTDSEAVFCAILNALHAEFPDDQLPTLPVLHEFLSCLCQEIVQDDPSTIFNFLLGCGQYVQFAYSWPGRRPGSDVWNGLYYIVRQPPFSTATLLDDGVDNYTIDFAQYNTTENDRVAVITTSPLTQEPGWTEFRRGELLMFDKGLPYKTPQCCEAVEREGRGLYSKEFALPHQKCHWSPTIRSYRMRSSSSSSSSSPSLASSTSSNGSRSSSSSSSSSLEDRNDKDNNKNHDNHLLPPTQEMESFCLEDTKESTETNTSKTTATATATATTTNSIPKQNTSQPMTVQNVLSSVVTTAGSVHESQET